MLQCKKCYSQLFESNAQKEHGDLIIECRCGAKNILAPRLINKVALWNFFEVIAYRE